MDKKLIVSSSPHISAKTKTRNIMLDVIIALIPAVIASVVVFGPRALVVTVATIAASVLSEYVCRKVMKRECTVGDYSAIVTGLLLALNLPSSIPIYIAVLGGIIAIVVVKQMFGGLGQNFVNPALASRIILMVSFPTAMTKWLAPMGWLSEGALNVDATTSATPLALIANGDVDALPTYMDMFLGNRGGSLGETCALALILGGIYLIARKVISPIIPVVYIVVVAAFSAILGQDPLMAVLNGGLLIGAIFMATDYVTSPLTNKGKVIYAIGCGLLTVLIRTFASLPEGVSYSIVLMNILTPHIENLTTPKAFGVRKEASK